MTGNCSHAAAAAAAAAPAAAAAAELVSWNCLAAAAAAEEAVAWSSAAEMASVAVFESVACEVDDGTTAEIKSLLPSGCRFAGEEAAAITQGEEEEGAANAILFLFILRFLV